jgi:N-carbamoyl-L-amino-acid hydrolase
MAATSQQLDIDGARFLSDLRLFSQIGGRPDGGLDRLAWSSSDLEGRRWLAERMRQAGLDVRTDEALNVFGHAPQPHPPFLLIGSHADSVPAGGHLDGAYGVIAALEVMRTLVHSEHPLAPRVEMVAFADEEGVRFGEGLLGSEALCGEVHTDRLRTVRDRDGLPATDVLAQAGLELERMNDAARHLPDIGKYLELHIEQGPRMELQGLDLAVVSGIVGVYRQLVVISGQQNHAGTTPFAMRKDAGRAAARAIAGLRELVQAIDGDAVANVGRVRFDPGGPNIVPGQADFDVEVRHLQPAVIARIVDEFNGRLHGVCLEEGCTATIEVRSSVAPAAMDDSMMAALRRACDSLDRPVGTLWSGAGHDAQVMARHVPAAMLFVPSKGGISHAPAEATSDDHLVLGVRALHRGVVQILA